MSTTYMNLNLPVPTLTPGPTWAANVNTAITTIDSHDHSPGRGTAVPASGLNINADLDTHGNKLLNVKGVNLTSEIATLPTSNVQAVYSYSGDLWFNNSSGVPVQITQGSSVTSASSPLVPSGVIWAFGGVSAPTGFLLCDGSAVSRTGYAALYAAIGTAYGVGDGSTTFTLPDMRGRAPIGAGVYTDPVSGAITRAMGQAMGAEKHQLTSGEMPSHTHVQNAHTHGVTDPSHTHSLVTDGGGSGASAAYSITNSSGFPVAAVTSAALTGISINNATASNQATGGGAVHNNMQPSLVTNFIIKT